MYRNDETISKAEWNYLLIRRDSMIYPKFIQKNDCIAVPAPSAGAWDVPAQNRMLHAQKKLEALGYRMMLSENIFQYERGRSASAEERAKEMNRMFENDDIRLILCAAGGDFLVEMLPYVDFDLLKAHPKLVAGFSDPTGLLYPITTKYDIATIYGKNFKAFGAEDWHRSEIEFWEIAKGNIIKQESYDLYEQERVERITGLEGYHLTEKVEWHTAKEQVMNWQGRIIGGCLDLIAELAGTKYDGLHEFQERYQDDGIIWYFDICDFSKEETILTLWKLNELNYFKYTKGVVIGRFGNDNSFYDYDAKTCLEDSVLMKQNIPIIWDADVSHKGPCLNIINGSIATINAGYGKGEICFELK